MKIRLILLLALSACSSALAQERPADTSGQVIPDPDRTLLFAQRDTCELLLDFYAAAPGAGPCADAPRKPLIIHVFGGAFVSGQRDNPGDRIWFRQLADAGYNVAAIDYRLGMKGARFKASIASLKVLRHAIQIAVDDLFSATAYLVDNAAQLGIDPDKIVVSGSSAGAMTAMQAEWEICNGMDEAKVLPVGFNYAGIMSFAGAVFSMDGAVRFPRTPCPVLLFHGTSDRVVPYKKISLPGIQFAGSDALAEKLARIGANCQIYRFDGIGHEVAASMRRNVPEELRFLEENVIKGLHRTVDALVEDAGMPDYGWSRMTARDLY
ncbi:MAG: alpha/beta hydrolase fold domain-containing protein [Bacteroidales bacterium]|jgi:acetyl esterase/lipase|nr:alpha/beta hydrolase fold domain-containing protein [Bacteroidales bacterium]